MTLHLAPPIHRHDPADLASCCVPSAPLSGGSRVARTAPRQVATLTFGPCHVRCHCAPVPPATAPARTPVQVAHPLPPALHERKGNHTHNGQEKRNGKQHQRQARRGDPSRQDNRRHLAEHPHGRRRVLLSVSRGKRGRLAAMPLVDEAVAAAHTFIASEAFGAWKSSPRLFHAFHRRPVPTPSSPLQRSHTSSSLTPPSPFRPLPSGLPSTFTTHTGILAPQCPPTNGLTPIPPIRVSAQ